MLNDISWEPCFRDMCPDSVALLLLPFRKAKGLAAEWRQVHSEGLGKAALLTKMTKPSTLAADQSHFWMLPRAEALTPNGKHHVYLASPHAGETVSR